MLKPGLMMDRPLLLSGILEHAAKQVWRARSCLARNTWPFVSLHLCRLRKAFTPIGQCTARLEFKRRQRGGLDCLEQPPSP